MHNIRIGQAVDIHQLQEGRKLILGGVEIEQEKYDKMMEKAGIKALKRAVELGAFTQEKLELWLK